MQRRGPNKRFGSSSVPRRVASRKIGHSSGRLKETAIPRFKVGDNICHRVFERLPAVVMPWCFEPDVLSSQSHGCPNTFIMRLHSSIYGMYLDAEHEKIMCEKHTNSRVIPENDAEEGCTVPPVQVAYVVVLPSPDSASSAADPEQGADRRVPSSPSRGFEAMPKIKCRDQCLLLLESPRIPDLGFGFILNVADAELLMSRDCPEYGRDDDGRKGGVKAVEVYRSPSPGGVRSVSDRNVSGDNVGCGVARAGHTLTGLVSCFAGWPGPLPGGLAPAQDIPLGAYSPGGARLGLKRRLNAKVEMA